MDTGSTSGAVVDPPARAWRIVGNSSAPAKADAAGPPAAWRTAGVALRKRDGARRRVALQDPGLRVEGEQAAQVLWRRRGRLTGHRDSKLGQAQEESDVCNGSSEHVEHRRPGRG